MPFINPGSTVTSPWKDSGDTVSLVTPKTLDLNTTPGTIELNGDAGSSGQVLTSNGPGTPPSWETSSSGGSSQWQEAAGVVTLVNNTSTVSLDGGNGALTTPLVFSTSAGNSVIKTADASSNRLTIAGGSNTSGGTGGEARLEGGSSTGTGGPARVVGGGAIYGSGGPPPFVGGAAGVYAGEGTGSGGNIEIRAGGSPAGNDGSTGNIDILTPPAPGVTGNTGRIQIATKNTDTGKPGDLFLYTGWGYGPTSGGSIRIITGEGYGGSATTKNSVIDIGSAGISSAINIGQDNDVSRVTVDGGLRTKQRVFGSIVTIDSTVYPPYLELGRANVNRVTNAGAIKFVKVFAVPSGAINLDWTPGSTVTLIFTDSPGPLITHNEPFPPAGYAPVLLAGGVNFQTSANTVLGLVFDGTNWQEIFRKVP